MDKQKENKSLWRGFKRIWAREGERQKEKKKKSASRIPGQRAKSFGKMSFWLLIVLVVVLAVIGFQQSRITATKIPKQKSHTANQAITPQATEFGRSFLQTYYTFETTDEGVQAHEKQLASYLVKGLDPQAGLNLSSVQGSSRVTKVTLKDAEEKGNQKAYLTYHVEGSLLRKWTDEKVVEVKQGAKKVKKKQKQTKQETKEFAQDVVVPVEYVNGHFSVYDLPKFTVYQQKATGESFRINPKYEPYNGSTSEIQTFLETFFKSYAEDDADKLAYLVAPTITIQGLNGTLQYKEIEEKEIRRGEGHQLLVWATVSFTNPDTGLETSTRYQLTLQKGKKEKRYLVQEWNQR
ncbi:conjugal transfer protein [Listeria goaensis]|uniref:conjugal transfer protein n=1 Tax=Listeria goaensis TaxID=1649188 RepID=UPI000B59607C|nr:conjugal transfer protein [Listeria goaensis]